MDLVLASNNNKKLQELDSLLSSLGINLIPQGDLNIPEAEESFMTFFENALAKARHASRLSGKPAIADDSGLSVQCLGGNPGILSARYAQQSGEEKSDAANNALLFKILQGKTNRQARFICTLVALRHADDPEPLVAMGRWNGVIVTQPAGSGGFGYDPLLYIPDLGKTVAQLSAEEKNEHSHRAKAMKQMLDLMRTCWFDFLPSA